MALSINWRKSSKTENDGSGLRLRRDPPAMMNTPQEDTPAELKGITEVLQKSLRPEKDENIPPMPEDLRDRLKGQYGDTSAIIAEESEEGWSNRLMSLFAQPAFVGSLAALVLVAVLISLLVRPNPKDSTEVMRGGGEAVSATQVIIILFGLDEGQIQSVKESGYFEKKHLYTTSSKEELAQWVARDGDSIVVDGAAGEVRHEDGRRIALPEENISDAVLELLEK